MKLDQAYIEAVSGLRLTAAHMQPGVCLTYAFKGFRRTWPNGDGCEFIARADDEAADWVEYVEPVKLDAWGRRELTSAERIKQLDKAIAAHPSPSPQRSAKLVDDAIIAAMAKAEQAVMVEHNPTIPPAAWGRKLTADVWPATLPPAAPVRDAWGRPIG